MIGTVTLEPGGTRCGCLCSFQAEAYEQALAHGHGIGGTCAGSCPNGNTATLNANIATAVDRVRPDGR